MGNFLLNLARRVLKPGEGIQPRQVGLFEPAPGWVEFLPEADLSQVNSEGASQVEDSQAQSNLGPEGIEIGVKGLRGNAVLGKTRRQHPVLAPDKQGERRFQGSNFQGAGRSQAIVGQELFAGGIMEQWQEEAAGSRSTEPPRAGSRETSADLPPAQSQDHGKSPHGVSARLLGRGKKATKPHETEKKVPAGSGAPRSVESVSLAWLSKRDGPQPEKGLAPLPDQPGQFAKGGPLEAQNEPGSPRPGSRAGERLGLTRKAGQASGAVILRSWAPTSSSGEILKVASVFPAPEVMVKRARTAPFSRVGFPESPGASHSEPEPGPAGSPTIQVTIGVLEIRASAPASDRSARRQPSSSVMSLDEYLGQRPRS